MAGPRSDLERVLEQARDDLRRLGRSFALIGGLAVSARTEPRFTRDIDLAVAVATDRDTERLARDLQAAGYRIGAMIEQEAVGRLATLRLLSPVVGHQPSVVVDVLVGSSGIEPEIAASATELEIFPGITLPVAGIPELHPRAARNRFFGPKSTRCRCNDRVFLPRSTRARRGLGISAEMPPKRQSGTSPTRMGLVPTRRHLGSFPAVATSDDADFRQPKSKPRTPH